MCQFPAWVETKDTVFFFTDPEIKKAKKTYGEGGSHSLIREVFKVSGGQDKEGFPVPSVIASAIRKGEVAKIAKATGLKKDQYMVDAQGNLLNQD